MLFFFLLFFLKGPFNCWISFISVLYMSLRIFWSGDVFSVIQIKVGRQENILSLVTASLGSLDKSSGKKAVAAQLPTYTLD